MKIFRETQESIHQVAIIPQFFKYYFELLLLFISFLGINKEISLHNILHSIRQRSFPDNLQLTRITLNALKHLLNQLESESRIYQSNFGCYSVA